MTTSPLSIEEAKRSLEVSGNYDVIVCGSGPAGSCAALSAARAGAKVLLLEVHGCLGGVWTSGLLSWVIDAGNKGGIMRLIGEELEKRGARRMRKHNYAYDPEGMKLLLEDLCLEAGVTIRLHTRVASVIKQGRSVQGVITESKSGREAWLAPVIIDCSGDGEIAWQAGCATDYGHPETGEAQPMSLIALLTGIHAEAIHEFVGGGLARPKMRLNEEIQRGGHTCSYSSPTLFPISDDFFALMANHEYGVSPFSADDLTRATLSARREIHHIVRSLRSLGQPWDKLRLVTTAEQIGIREGRRVAGLYQVTLQDLIEGTRHPDAVCECTFGPDVHSTNPAVSKDYMKEGRPRTQPYDIPYRALVARDVDGLLIAGRCISGDFYAHSSYRVTGDAAAMGEAAGFAAALATQKGCPPASLAWEDIRQLRGY